MFAVCRCVAATGCRPVPCYGPLAAYKPPEGALWFGMPRIGDQPIEISCGQCIGCRLERSRQWAIRCLHESQMYEFSSFITLTYNDDFIPVDHSLNYRDFQLFMMRLRKHFSHRDDYGNNWRLPIRFFMCGEYGETTCRPHFHACLFNCYFADRRLWKPLSSGSNLYTSEVLSRLWSDPETGKSLGFSSIGDVTFESAAYVARYVVKKITGPNAGEHYKYVSPYGEVFAREPEFVRMSLKPGIGAPWLRKFSAEVYPRDEVIVRGMRMKPPKYYDNLLAATDLDSFEFLELDRYNKSLKLANDATPARLQVREKVARAGLTFKRRTLE